MLMIKIMISFVTRKDIIRYKIFFFIRYKKLSLYDNQNICIMGRNVNIDGRGVARGGGRG